MIHAQPRTSAPKAIRASASFTSVSHGQLHRTPVNINVSTGTKANGNPCIFK